MSYLHGLVFYQPITPLHVGCGQDVGVVDLPVIRERTTGYPFIPGSGIRGSLRQTLWRRDSRNVALLFGPTAEESETGPRYAGCVAVHDAHLLLFPVRSDRAPFLWITCPAVLHRFSRDVRVLLGNPGTWPVEPSAVSSEESLAGSLAGGDASLEELVYHVEPLNGGEPGVSGLATWLGTLGTALGVSDLSARTALVSDGSFHYFVTHATQILQHNRLTSAKTVAQGQLFSVEAVPPEAIFYGFLGATEPRRPQEEVEAENDAAAEAAEENKAPATSEQVLAALQGLFNGPGACTYLQLGGDEGTGLGVTRLSWADGASSSGDSHAS
jgi:CRISPR-associated protein Cmr4